MVDFGAIIGESAEWTKQALFKPFNFKKWMVLTFIALMAGTMSNGCNFNSGGSGGHGGGHGGGHHYEQKQVQAPQGSSSCCAPTAKAPSAAPMASTLMLIAGVALILIALFLLFVLLGSRFSFVFLEDVIKNDASIKAPFAANKEQGNSYYQFNLALMLVLLVILGSLVFLGIVTCAKMGLFSAFNTQHPDPKAVVELILVLIPFFLVFMLIIFIVSLVSVITIDLVLPIMYKEKTKILAAWGKAWALVKKNAGNFTVYILIKIGLGMGAGIVYVLAFIVGFIIVVIPVALLILALWFISKTMPPIAILSYWIFFGVILTPVCLFLLYCLMALNLPFAVFFRTYSLKFLERLDPQYALIKTEKPVAAQ